MVFSISSISCYMRTLHYFSWSILSCDIQSGMLIVLCPWISKGSTQFSNFHFIIFIDWRAFFSLFLLWNSDSAHRLAFLKGEIFTSVIKLNSSDCTQHGHFSSCFWLLPLSFINLDMQCGATPFSSSHSDALHIGNWRDVWVEYLQELWIT